MLLFRATEVAVTYAPPLIVTLSQALLVVHFNNEEFPLPMVLGVAVKDVIVQVLPVIVTVVVALTLPG